MLPVHVVQLVDGFATEEHAGGAAQFAIRLARQLDRTQFQPHVVGLWRYNTPSERRWLETLRQESIATTVLIEERATLSLDLARALGFLRTLVAEQHVRVVNSHFERGDLLALMTKLTTPGLRIVRTQHTDQQWQKRPWLGALLNTAAFPWWFDAEVAISAATRDVLDRRPAAQVAYRRAALIYNGLSPAALAELARVRGFVGLRGSAPNRLAIVGRLAPQKGHTIALEALAQVRRERPDTELWVIGHGELRGELEQQARALGIAHAVHFLGQRSDISALLAQVDLLVSPSLWEGFPTVILEAMAAGVPVVASDVSGSRELVRSGVTGELVPVGDARMLAQAIRRMLSNASATQVMAAQAHHEVQRFGLDTIARDYGRLYTNLIR